MAGKVLVVDDDPDILDSVTVILEPRGYTVITAHDGWEGLEALKAENPDLMLLDLKMPMMDGFCVCRELQHPRWFRYRYTPIIIMSSAYRDTCCRRYELGIGLDLNVDDYIEKPMSPDVLLERVGVFVNKRKTCKSL